MRLKLRSKKIHSHGVGLIRAALVLLCCYSSSSIATAARSGMEYQITIDKGLRSLTVNLCFDRDKFSDTLEAAEDLAHNISDVTAKWTDGSSSDLQLWNRTVELKDRSTECISYAVKIRPSSRDNRRSGLFEHNGAIAIALDRVLLIPHAQDRWQQTRLTFYAAPDVKVAAPGSALPGKPGKQTFDLFDRPIDWKGTVAFGPLTQSVVQAGGATVIISIIGETNIETANALHRWIVTGLDAITTLYGHFPVTELQLLVFPVSRNSDPLPWGEVTRGGGDAVHLYVDGTRSVDELNANWVLSHELSHLIHPYISSADAWLPEGIASYFQNVLRARSALIEQRVGWQKLDAGFRRGRAQFERDRTLARDTREMMGQGQYMRVYWSGAAIALISDVELRRRSGGATSLDTVFEELSRCCLPSERRWTASELMTKMDRIAGYDVFMPLYRRYVMEPMFPDLEETYRRLGLSTNPEGLELSVETNAASLRADIMGER